MASDVERRNDALGSSLAPLRSLLLGKRLAWAADQSITGDQFYHLGLPRAPFKESPLSGRVPT